MMVENIVNSEPVPAATQLALVAINSAIDGYLRSSGTVEGLRTTIHRTMSRNGIGYLQQACAYAPMTQDWKKKVGRVFPVTVGILGAAYSTGKLWRTRRFDDVLTLKEALAGDMSATGDSRELDEVGLSYLAIPFIGPTASPVLVLYSECNTFNFFADELRIKSVVAICESFCSTFDQLDKEKTLGIRNFPLGMGRPHVETPTLYRTVQEELPLIPPRFSAIEIFNFDMKPQ